MNEIIYRIAEEVRKHGGTAYLVGGCVRDGIMGRPQKDWDIEIHGIPAEDLPGILSPLGTPLSYGSSFGVVSFPGIDLDIAMPRRERANPDGRHRGFDVDIDPFIGTEAAARRRDFTVNALMKDILTGEVIDHFGGKEDISRGILRHVDDVSFPEDPLRVFRAAQFAARLGFTVAPETVELCSRMDVSQLTSERVEAELKKALLEAAQPSVFFEVLSGMGQLSPWFSEIEMMKDVEQDPVYHPEGNVFIHSMQVLDRAAAYRENVRDPYSFMLLALLHDIGKITATETVNGRIHAYGHEVMGAELLESFMDRIIHGNSVKQYLRNMIPLHMRPNVAASRRVPVKTTNHMFDEAAECEDLIYMAMSDRPVMAGDTPFTGDSAFLFERLEIYRQTMSRPYVEGKDLVEAGLEPGKDFSELLAFAHKLRLACIDKESALKQTLAYSRKLSKKRGE